MATPRESEVKAEEVRSETADDSTTAPAHMNFSVGLPKFTGDSGLFERFVDDFNIFASLQRWSDERKRDVLPLCLSGIARDAYDSLSSAQKSSFELMVAGLKPSFAGRTPIDCHMLLTSLRYDPGEPLDAFVIHLRKLVSRAFPGQMHDGLMFNHFLMALPDDYLVQVVAAGITSFDAAVTKVRNLSSALRVGAAEVRQLRADPDIVTQLQRRIEELERRLESGGLSRAAPVRNSPPPDGSMGAEQRRLCFVCGQPGHFRSACRHRGATCYRCQEKGHLANVCRARLSGN